MKINRKKRLNTAKVPKELEPLFSMAQDYVSRYFSKKKEKPSKGTIEIFSDRYILVRAASMSVDFYETVKSLYAKEGEDEARNVAWNILFDIAHAIGKTDARNFHEKMKLKEPVEKLSAGPIHFAYSGWAFVDIFPESSPVADESYYLIYDHPFSFESHAWIRAGKRAGFPVCVMNAGYSSGWCEESFGIPLVASEIMCRAKGDDACRFIMATPGKIEEYINRYLKREPELAKKVTTYEIPGFFKRKQLEEERRRAEEALRKARDELEIRVEERTAELVRTNISLQEEIKVRRRAEEALRESEETFRAMTTTAADSILLVDEQGRITYWNPAAEKTFGYSSEEITGKELHVLLAPDKSERTETDVSILFKKTEDWPSAGKTVELAAVRKDGVQFPVEISASFVKIKGSWHSLCLIRDVTERKRMEEELFRTRKLESVGILAGGLAHDFNNILTGILGNISFARRLIDGGEGGAQSLIEAEKACFQARNLANSLLTFSRGGAPVREPTSIIELIMDTTTFALSGSKTKPVFDLADKLWPVEIDKGQVSQVINNLVINADQAMTEGGQVAVSAENERVGEKQGIPLKGGRYVKITIRDTGSGIPSELLPKIFDPYFTTKPDGSGLGLASAYSIIKNHDGLITVQSAPEEGASFFIYLPASEKELPAMHDAKDEALDGQGRILVMDDSKIVIKVTARILEQLGYEADFAGDGTEAIDLYSRARDLNRPYDAVIMDLTIPGGMGGKEAVKKLLEIDPGAKVIVSSGYADDPIMSDFRRYGFSGVVAKPFSVEELGIELRKVMGSGGA